MSNIDQAESGSQKRPEHCISAFPEAETPYNEEEKDLFRNLSPHRRIRMSLLGREAEK